MLHIVCVGRVFGSPSLAETELFLEGGGSALPSRSWWEGGGGGGFGCFHSPFFCLFPDGKHAKKTVTLEL